MNVPQFVQGEKTVTLERWQWGIVAFLASALALTALAGALAMNRRVTELGVTAVDESTVRRLVVEAAPYNADREWIRESSRKTQAQLEENTKAITDLRVQFAESLRVKPADVLDELRQLRRSLEAAGVAHK